MLAGEYFFEQRRSRKGAWIEISAARIPKIKRYVAPVRERGLKSLRKTASLMIMRRSRKGAWIEIPTPLEWYLLVKRRSRKGAWIEIPV